MKSRLLLLIGSIIIGAIVVACGGGGGGSSTTNSAAPSPTTYVSGVAAGDFGNFVVSADKKSYTFTFIDSAYGLAGKTRSGTLTQDTATSSYTSYIATDSVTNKSFPVYIAGNYAIASVQIDQIQSPANFVPVFGVVKGQSITSASQLLGTSNIFKNAGFSCNANKVNTSQNACWATSSIVILSAGSSDNQLNITVCDNGSKQENNGQLSYCYANRANPSALTTQSVYPGAVTKYTASSDATTGVWTVTPVSGSATQTIRGVFTLDTNSNSLVGFFDTVGNVAGSSSGFSLLTSNFSTLNQSSLTAQNYYATILQISGQADQPFEQILFKTDGTTYDVCSNGAPVMNQIPMQKQTFFNQLDFVSPTAMTVPGYFLEESNAALQNSSGMNYTNVGFFIANNTLSGGLFVEIGNRSGFSNTNNYFMTATITSSVQHCY